MAGEQITQPKFDALKAIWDKLKSGTGQIKITDTGDDGTKYPAFKAMILTRFGVETIAPDAIEEPRSWRSTRPTMDRSSHDR